MNPSEPIKPIITTPEDEGKADKLIADTLVFDHQITKKAETFEKIQNASRSDLTEYYNFIRFGIPQEQEVIIKIKNFLANDDQSAGINPVKREIIQDLLAYLESDSKAAREKLIKVEAALKSSESSGSVTQGSPIPSTTPWHPDPKTTGEWFDTGTKAVGFVGAAAALWIYLKEHAGDAARNAAGSR
jgi:hypothetical protein